MKTCSKNSNVLCHSSLNYSPATLWHIQIIFCFGDLPLWLQLWRACLQFLSRTTDASADRAPILLQPLRKHLCRCPQRTNRIIFLGTIASDSSLLTKLFEKKPLFVLYHCEPSILWLCCQTNSLSNCSDNTQTTQHYRNETYGTIILKVARVCCK